MINKRVYCPKDSDFTSYYNSQIGSGFGDIRVIRAPRFQRGYGFGSFIARIAMPVMKYLGKEVLNKGVSLGKRVVQDPELQQAFKESVKDLTNKGLSRIKQQINPQLGSGRKRLYKRKKVAKRSVPKIKPTPKKVTKRKVKRKPRDIFT